MNADCAAPNSGCKINASDSSGNECVACTSDADCGPEAPICDLNVNECTDRCANSSQCGLTTPICNEQSQICVQCLSNGDCAAPAATCNTATARCVECLDDTACGGGVCDTADHICIGCLDSAQCLDASNAPCLTDPAAPDVPNTCVDCVENGDCAGNPALSRCQNGTCAVCVDDTACGAFPGLGACKTGVGCVECVDAADCTGNPNGPVCKTVDEGGPAPINTCVQCQSNVDCQSPEASVCSNSACVPCTDSVDAGCSHIDSNGTTAGGTPLNVCDAGICVQCSGSKRAGCDPFVCNATTKTCTTNRPARTADACDSCVSDQECAVNSRCVRQTFGGRDLGFSCFPMAAGNPAACVGPRIFLGLVTRATIDGEDATTPTVCQPRQTTCAALAELQAGCDNDADCGEATLADGVCNTELDQCSVPCAVNNDCTQECDPATGLCTLD